MAKTASHQLGICLRINLGLRDQVEGLSNLGELTVAILGVGQMGTATAAVFKSLGSRVFGLVRSSRPPDLVVDKFFTREELPELLSSVDYILAMLPATPETDNLLGDNILSHCDGVGLVNLGRGNICSEEQVNSFNHRC